MNCTKIEMKKLISICVALLIVATAGFGSGQYVMWMKIEPVMFEWMENAHNWQYEAERNQVAADYYRQNATQNIFVAEQLKEICNNYEAENLELIKQVDMLEDTLHEVLNPEWEINY